jgi:hypothetical protein
VRGRGRGTAYGEEMAQTIHAHMNKQILKIKN